MEKINFTKNQRILLIGDVAAILLTVVIGFQSHETGAVFFQRFAFTFLPWTFSWLLIAPKFNLFDLPTEKINKQIVKIFLAMLFASPLAAVLRAAWLGSSALPIFALILGFSTAIGLIIWRLIYMRWFTRSDQ